MKYFLPSRQRRFGYSPKSMNCVFFYLVDSFCLQIDMRALCDMKKCDLKVPDIPIVSESHTKIGHFLVTLFFIYRVISNGLGVA